MRLLLIGCFALAVGSCQKPSPERANESAQTAPAPPVKGVDRSHKGQFAPRVQFNDPAGQATSLKAFAGRPTLVNLWASWCAPCVKELPTLDRVASVDGSRLNVVAISQDMAPHASVEAFLKSHHISTLRSYQDPRMALSGALDAEVLPTSILYDASGREVWRYVGDKDWTSAGAARLLGEAGVRTGG